MWSFGDSIWFALENLPMIGGAFQSVHGGPLATMKATQIAVEQTGIPDPSVESLDKLSGGLQTAANILTGALVVAGLFYGYKIIREIKR